MTRYERLSFYRRIGGIPWTILRTALASVSAIST